MRTNAGQLVTVTGVHERQPDAAALSVAQQWIGALAWTEPPLDATPEPASLLVDHIDRIAEAVYTLAAVQVALHDRLPPDQAATWLAEVRHEVRCALRDWAAARQLSSQGPLSVTDQQSHELRTAQLEVGSTSRRKKVGNLPAPKS